MLGKFEKSVREDPVLSGFDKSQMKANENLQRQEVTAMGG